MMAFGGCYRVAAHTADLIWSVVSLSLYFTFTPFATFRQIIPVDRSSIARAIWFLVMVIASPR